MIPKNLNIFEKKLETNGTGFLVGDSITIADLILFTMIDSVFYEKECLTLLEPYPHLKEFENRIRVKNVKIAEWLKKRPKTKM